LAPGSTRPISGPVRINAGKSLTSSGGGTVTYQSTVSVGAGGTFAGLGSADVATLALAGDAIADVNGSLLLRGSNVADVTTNVRDRRITSSSASNDPKHARGL